MAGVATCLQPHEWLQTIGRLASRDDSATHWDARGKIAW